MRVKATINRKDNRSQWRSHGFLAIITCILLPAGTGQVAASGMPVIDFTHMIENITTQITTRIQDLAKYEQMITNGKDQLQQQINTLNDLQGSLAALKSFADLQSNISLKEIDDENTFLVQERCGSVGGGGVTGVLGSLTGIDLRGNVFKQQHDICVAMQVMRNKQFNLTVRYLAESLETAKQVGTDLRTMSAGTDQSGKKLDAVARLNQAEIELNQRQAKDENEFSAYQKYIDIQMKTQSALAIGAMRGDPGPVSKVTQAAAMGLALCGGDKCDND